MNRTILGILVIALLIFAAHLVGCQGAPQYGMVKNKTDSELDLGWGRKLRLGPDIEAELHGLKTANGTQIDSVIFKQAPSVTMAQGVVPTMYAYSEQQKQFVPVLRQYGDNAIGILGQINEIAKTIMPTVSSYLSGRTSVSLAKQQTKQLQSEMIAGIASGVLNPNEMVTTMTALPDDVQRAVLSDPVVLAKLEQLAAQITALAATTQPTETPGTTP